MNKITFFVLSLLVLSLFVVVRAQEVEFEGFGKTGIRVWDRNPLLGANQEMYFEGKLQLELEYNDNIEAQLDFRGNSIDNSVEFREFSIKLDYAEKLRWKTGHIKKPFGYEYLVARDELISVNRSNVYEHIAELGYGGRSVSIMAYYKYSKKREEFPYSYYLSVYKDNARNTGLVGRGVYHTGSLAYGISYLFQNRGGRHSLSAHGFGGDVLYERGNYLLSSELYFVQDPVEGRIRKAANKENDTQLNETVYTSGVKILTALIFETDAEVIKRIEPFLMGSYLVPDMDVTGNHVIQALIGANFYFLKKVSLRFNADLVLTKNEFNSDYVTDESKVIIEMQVRF